MIVLLQWLLLKYTNANDHGLDSSIGKNKGERLKTAPKGYDPIHPEIELLQLKLGTALHHFPDQEVLASDFPEKAVTICRAMKLYFNYPDDALQ
jgi:Conserved hypothetical protein (DUF2461)